MHRLGSLSLATLLVLGACGTATTAPELVVDPALTFDAAHARWVTFRPANYSFEFNEQGSWFFTPGYSRATVADGRLVALRPVGWHERVSPGAGFTIDELWERLTAARTRGEMLSNLQFSREGIPVLAIVGDHAVDGGMTYRLRAFAPTD